MSALKITVKTGAYALAGFIFLCALCLQGMRTALFFAEDYQQPIQRFLSERLTADVSFSDLHAHWYGLRPTIELQNLSIVSRIDGSTVSASNALVVLDLSDTVLQRSPVFKHVSFTDLSLSVYQNEDGAWSDSGFFSSNKSRVGAWRYRSPADLFNTVKFAELINTQIKLQFLDGRTLDVVLPYSDIINNGDNHYLNISASVDDNEEVFSIRVEGVGRPSQADEFRAKALVELNAFPAGHLVHLLVNQNLSIEELNEASLDAQLWFDFETTRRFSMVGDFSFSGGLPSKQSIDSSQAVFAINSLADIAQVPLTATITADYELNERLEMTLQDIIVDDQLFLSPVNFLFVDRVFSVATKTVDIEELSEWMSSHLVNSKITQTITALSPKGQLQNVNIQNNFNAIDSFVLQARGVGLGINAYQNIPQFEQVNGLIETNLSQGRMILDAQKMVVNSQSFFNQSFRVEKITGELFWQLSPEKNNISIQGDGLKAEAEFGLVNAYFDLDIPWQPNTKKSHLLLQLGLQNSKAEYSSLFLPTILPIEFTGWVDSAVQQADIEQVGVLYRGPMSRSDDYAIQVFVDVNEGTLDYQSEWPALSDISAQIIYDNNYAIAEVYQASVYDDLMQATIDWNRNQKNLLTIESVVESSASSTLRFIKNSPLKSTVDNDMLSWQVSGDLAMNLSLDFNLDQESDFSSQIVDVKLSNNSLFLPEENLLFNEANGVISYSSDSGFSSSELNGVLFGENVLVDIQTEANGDIKLSGSGAATVSAVSQWLEEPLMAAIANGRFNYNFDFLVPKNSSNAQSQLNTQYLSIFSDLKGVVIDLPQPFSKAKNESKELLLDGQFKNDESKFTLQFDTSLYSEMNFWGDASFKAIVNASDNPVFSIPESFVAEHQDKNQGLFISGEFNQLDVESWLPFFDTLDRVTEKVEEPFDVFYSLEVRTLQFMDLNIDNIVVAGFSEADVWQSTIASNLVAGNILLNEKDEVPLTINLDYLIFPKKERLLSTTVDNASESEKIEVFVDPLADVSFEDIESADVTIQHLEYGGKPLGQWSFNIDAKENEIIFDNLEVRLAELSLSGMATGQGARLRWSRVDDKEQTHFIGKVEGGSLKEVFASWGLPPAVSNEHLFVTTTLQWPGSPLAIQLESVSGDLSFLLENGVFTQTDSNATGVLRVLSFFNFDTWVRRLRLDFTGMLDNGMSFENASARILFNEGIINLDEPVEVNSSEFSLSMSGYLDYPNDAIDGNLAVVLPVGGNLNFAAALAAGLPAAVGVYLIRKIFKDAISEASTVNYKVSGSINKPEITFRGGDE